MDAFKRYRELLALISERKEAVGRFSEMLETKTTWLTSPASTRFHLNIEGGLLIHSVNVTETLLKLRPLLAPGFTEESCAIVGLFHDTGKVGMPGRPYYLPNLNEWEIKKQDKKYRINPDLVTIAIGARSLYLVSKYVPLSDQEAQAIVYHDGLFVPEGQSILHHEEPLTLLLHWADCWSASLLEAGKEPHSDTDYYTGHE